MRLGFVLAIACFVACADEGLVVDVDLEADPCVSELAARLEVRVLDESGSVLETFDADPVFPSGVRLSASDALTEWRVEATLYDANDVPLTDVAANGTFQDGATRRRFEDACLGIVCGEAESCSGGLCVSEEGFVSPPAAAAPATCPAWLFVSTEGSDTASCGDYDSPCATLSNIAAENGRLSAGGGVVNIAGGTYDGLSLLGGYSGPVVVRAWPGTGTVVLDAGGDDSAVVVRASDITLQDLSVRGAVDHGISVNVTMTVRQERIRIRRCTVTGNGSNPMPAFNNKAGLQFNNNVWDFVVEDSVFEDNDGPDGWNVSGMYVNKTSNGLIRRNRFVGNRTAGIQFSESTNIEVRDNVFLSNGARGVLVSDGTSATFEGNRFCGHSEAGIRSSSELTTEIVRNTFAQNEVGIVRLSPSGGTLSYDHNVFLDHTGPAVEFQTSAALAPVDGVNLYHMNMRLTLGFDRSAPDDDVQADPMLSGLEDCSLTRSSPDPYPDFGAP